MLSFCDPKPGFCIFRAVVMIACLSKYDFWNLHKIPDWHEKKIQKIFFWNRKKSRKKFEKYFLGDFPKNFKNFQNSLRIFEKNLFLKIKFFEKSLRNFEIFENFSENLPKNIFRTFFEIFFYFEKNISIICFSCQSKIFQRFQKSYLESHLMTASARKMQNPCFSTQNRQIWLHLVTCLRFSGKMKSEKK